MNSGPAVRETFSRDDRLRKRREFQECYASGVRVSGRYVQVSLLAQGSGRLALGISVSRRVGNAVMRNRVRRRLREIFRRHRAIFGSDSAHVVVNAKSSAATASFEELSEDYRSSVARARRRVIR